MLQGEQVRKRELSKQLPIQEGNNALNIIVALQPKTLHLPRAGTQNLPSGKMAEMVADSAAKTMPGIMRTRTRPGMVEAKPLFREKERGVKYAALSKKRFGLDANA